jgi:hypothetical protein
LGLHTPISEKIAIPHREKVGLAFKAGLQMRSAKTTLFKEVFVYWLLTSSAGQ